MLPRPRMTTRRSFLRTTAAVAAAAAARTFPAALPAAPTAAAPALGFSLYGMKSLALPDALAACARIGYRSVELSLLPGYPTEPRLLRPADVAGIRRSLGQHRLGVAGLMLNLSLLAAPAAHAANLDAIAEAAALAHELDPAAPPPLETVLGGKPENWLPARDGMLAQLRDWGRVAAANRITLALKAHALHAVNAPDRLLWLLGRAESPALAVAYDHSHYALAGLGVADSLRPLAARTAFVHVKDAHRDRGAVRFLLPDAARTDYVAYFRDLRAAGLSLPVVVEVSSQLFNQPGYDPVAAAESSFRVLQAGLTPAP